MGNKVGIITSWISPTSKTFLSNLSSILLHLFNNINIIVGCSEDLSLNEQIADLHVHRIKHVSGIRFFNRILNYIILEFKISILILRLINKVDIWVLFKGSECLLIPVLVSKILRKKVILFLVGSLELEGKLKKDRLYYPLTLFKNFNCILADKIILYSANLIKPWGLDIYSDKIEIAHEHFLDFQEFSLEIEVDRRLNVVGYIGRLSEEKGIFNFLKSIVLLKAYPIQFIIIGDGPLREEMILYLKKNNLESIVSYKGLVPHTKIKDCLNDLKLLVLPSYTEGIPNIILEAMACGTPVLATPVGCIPDIIKDEITGFIIQKNDPEKISKNILDAIANNHLEMITKNAQKLIQAEFSFEKGTANYKKIFDSINNK